VHAIDEYKKENGTYPQSLIQLAPKYLPRSPDIPDATNGKFAGWDYVITTNGTIVSYTLRYYMGRGGVEYEPPNWIRNNEGSREIILRNK
jgi:hypothetical protein